MGATIIDSQIFGNIFSSDAMRRVWSAALNRAGDAIGRRHP
jgi:hypothetical protein